MTKAGPQTAVETGKRRTARTAHGRSQASGSLDALSSIVESSPVQAFHSKLMRQAQASPIVAHHTELQKAAHSSPRGEPIQRLAIMTPEMWQSLSARVGRKRSQNLLGIDASLMRYHATIDKDLKTQRAAAEILRTALNTWKESKGTKTKGGEERVNSRRAQAVAELQTQIEAKIVKLDKALTKGKEVGSRTNFTFDVYNLVRGRVQRILAIEKSSADPKVKRQLVADLGALREKARDIDADHNPVDALWDACSVMIALAERHLNVQVWTSTHNSAAVALVEYQTRFGDSLKNARTSLLPTSDYGARQSVGFREKATGYLANAEAEVALFSNITKPKSAEGPDLDLGEGYEQGMALTDEALNALGMQGTGGKGNEGLEDYWKSSTAERDDQRGAATMMSGLNTDNASDMDRLSGGADTASGIVMAGDVGVQIARDLRLIESLKGKTDKKSNRQRRGAYMRLAALGVPGFVAALGKAEGGAMTALRSGNNEQMPASTFFGHDAERGIDVSTDFKLAGDSAGTLVSAVGSVTALVDMVRNGVKRWKKVEGHSRTAAENAQAGFDTLHDLSGATAKVSGTVSGVIKIYHQIAGGGQVASESIGAATDMARGVVNGAPVIPILGLIKGVLDFIQQAIKLGRVAVAAKSAKKKAVDLVKTSSEAMLEAFTVTKEKFTKQIRRAIIELVHAGASITAGALTVSGLGAGVGAAIGMASSVAKLLQFGTRKFKQARRDKAAPKTTNLEQSAAAEVRAKNGAHVGEADGPTEFVSRTLEKTEERMRTGKRAGGMFNKDKSTVNKEFRYRHAALEILRAPAEDRKWFFNALGIERDIKRIMNDDSINQDQAKLKRIIASLKER